MKRWNYIKISQARQGVEGMKRAKSSPKKQKGYEKPEEYQKVVHKKWR